MKIIIIGGVAGGASAAARLRRLDEHAEITIYERSGYVSYANCGLPYYIGGVITERSELTLKTPQSFMSRFNIDVKVRHEVTDIDTTAKTVTIHDLENDVRFTDSYDKLILAPGAKATLPPFPVPDSARIFTLRTVEDTLAAREMIDTSKPSSAVIVGGGYIGLEMAENLAGLGMHVSIVQRPKHLLKTLDSDMASLLHAKLRKKGIDLVLGKSVQSITTDGDEIVTTIADAGELRSDIVLLALGVTPDTELASKAGIMLGTKGSIAVNERMETSAEGVYAVGDAVEVENFVSGKKVLISLAGPANKQGRIAADNICGGYSRYAGTIGTSIIKVFDMTVASAGLTEASARELGFDCEAFVLSPASHASYYPGSKSLTIKIVFERGTMKLLGAQIIGYDGVDKRMDVIVTAIRLGADAVSLKDFELSYAPPFGSAKDPVNLAGFMAENLATGKYKQFFAEDVPSLPRNGSVTLLDTRTPKEYETGRIDGFINIPLDELRDRHSELPEGKPIYVHCQSGLRSYIACRMLMQYGYECYNLSGGYGFYKSVMLEQLAAESSWPCGMEK